jgi:hypothetical protein
MQTEILNDVEQAAVQGFYQNEGMRESVKKVLLAAIYSNGTLKKGVSADPTRNAVFSLVANKPEVTNEQLGSDLRATWEGVRMVENAFNKMAEYQRKVEDNKTKQNKAR